MYALQKYGGITSRHTCPACGRKRCFTLYVDEAGEPLHATVGRCDHESSCGYHYTPRQYFHDHPSLRHPATPSCHSTTPSCHSEAQPKNLFTIPSSIVTRSIRPTYDSTLVTFLHTILDPLIVKGLIDAYRLGVTRARDVIYFQIDKQGRCRTGKVMKYDPDTGHRIKDENTPGRITWVHALMKRAGQLPADWALTQCLFGEHLLPLHPDQPVALVESEKTALICAGLMPGYLWLATGGKSQLNPDRLSVLAGRKVIAFPDIDAFDAWSRKLSSLTIPNPSCPTRPGISITVSPILQQNATPEDLAAHIDIADWLIRYRHPSRCHSERSPQGGVEESPSSRHPGLDPGSPRKRCLSFLRAARYIAPEHQDEVEALINDLDLEFWGAEKDEAGEEEPP